nr:hypothetical protein CFP56_42217 [Quercus suber]
MGAFGLNASIMDASNLAWKLGLCARGAADLNALGETYNAERGLHARRIIRTSGEYLRFVCGSDVPLAEFDIGSSPATNGNGTKEHVDGPDKAAVTNGEDHPDMLDDTKMDDLAFLHYFFSRHSQFLLGVDAGYSPSVLTPSTKTGGAIRPENGVRAPNPRVCLSTSTTGYLYDVLTGVDRFHVVLFGGEMLSDPSLPSRASLATLSATLASSKHFFSRYGGATRFHIVVVLKGVPVAAQNFLGDPDLKFLASNATLLFDDRTPDDDAHGIYEVDRARGAALVVRPDLWIGTSAPLDGAITAFDDYFGGFLLEMHGPR